MNPAEQAARWLAACPRWQAAYHEMDGPFMEADYDGEYLFRPHVLAAIARHLAPRDDLVAQATAALEGVTPGKPCQFHPSYCKEAEGTPFSEWDSSHDLSVILPDGKRYKIGHFRHSADAGFDQFARQWVPEAAARIAALTATVAEVTRENIKLTKQRDAGNTTLETYRTAQKNVLADNATLRARLARMEGALHTIDAHDPETSIGACSESALRGLVLRMGEIARAALTDGGTE